jgi:hypothetical protein
MHDRRTQKILLLVAVLLTLNLVVTLGGWLVKPPLARADLVSGKNWFTTSSPDGATVYLWQYWTTSEVGPDAQGTVKYYGMIRAGGSFAH